MIDKGPAVLNFNQLCLKLNQFICNYRPVLPVHWADARKLPFISEEFREFNPS